MSDDPSPHHATAPPHKVLLHVAVKPGLAGSTPCHVRRLSAAGPLSSRPLPTPAGQREGFFQAPECVGATPRRFLPGFFHHQDVPRVEDCHMLTLVRCWQSWQPSKKANNIKDVKTPVIEISTEGCHLSHWGQPWFGSSQHHSPSPLLRDLMSVAS